MTAAKSVLRMRRPLEAPLPVPAWPPGVGLADFTPAGAAEVYALLAEAYAHSGDTMGKFSPWWRALSADPEFDPKLCFVARDGGGSIVGVAQCWTSGFIKDLAVHSGWRRLGVGKALLIHAFAVLGARGVGAVELKVIEDNYAAVRLYASCGMQVVETIAVA